MLSFNLQLEPEITEPPHAHAQAGTHPPVSEPMAKSAPIRASSGESFDDDDDVWVENLHPMNEDDPPTKMPSEKKSTPKKRNWRLRQPSHVDICKQLFPLSGPPKQPIDLDADQEEQGSKLEESEEDEEAKKTKSNDKGTYKDQFFVTYHMHVMYQCVFYYLNITNQ